VPVQGEGAAEAICAALARANRRAECDLLILARGGGSLEDLMAFNDEALAYGIRASAIPVLTGIGHEIDLSIADLAADRRAPTPSAAAELAVPAAAALRQHLDALQWRLAAAGTARRASAARRLQDLLRRLQLRHPTARLEQRVQRLDRLRLRLGQAMTRRVDAKSLTLRRRREALSAANPLRRLRERRLALAALSQRLTQTGAVLLERRGRRFATLLARLEALSPLAVLRRGYAIASRTRDGEVLRAAQQARVGESISVRLASGQLQAEVRAVHAAPSAEPGSDGH
jgi:exodeoxyribonuclease VII large subunit